MSDQVDKIASALEERFEEERLITLRQAGDGDPLHGCPMSVRVNGDIVLIEPGKWKEEGYADPRTGLPPDCPVKPLGRDGIFCVFLDTLGQVHYIDEKGSKGAICTLFGGRPGYLWCHFARWSKPTKELPSKVNGWDADWARETLVMACTRLGAYRGTELVRGRGAWKDRRGGLIYHAGDAVRIGGRWMAPDEYDGHIYPGAPAIGRPTSRAQGVEPGQELLAKLRTFNWNRPELDARLALGWVMCAKVGGALDRRPILFAHGGEGSGKSTLQDLLRRVMSGALIATADASPAGIYQRLGQDSVAVMLDELEAKELGGRSAEIQHLARVSYSGDEMRRGGKDGVPKGYKLMSSFFCTAVNKPAMDAQDESRMAVLLLREREHAGGKLEVDPDWADATGRHLLRRWFDWWDRWPLLLETMGEYLHAIGHSDRSADTFAPLAAACHVALHDAMPTDEEIAEWQRWLEPTELEEIAQREATWRRCVIQIMDAPVDLWRTHDFKQKTIGAMFAAVRDAEAKPREADAKEREAWERSSGPLSEAARRSRDDALAQAVAAAGSGHWTTILERLPQLGMTVSWAQREPEDYDHARLFVPLSNPVLCGMFVNTPWAGHPSAAGPWGGALRQAPAEIVQPGTCDKGLPRKTRGVFVYVARAYEPDQ